MALRKIQLSDAAPFSYSFGEGIGGTMSDVGRTVGSKTVGLIIQTIPPGLFSSRRHKHVFQEELLIMMSGEGVLHHGEERIPLRPGDCVCYLPEDPEAHTFENTGSSDAVIWAFGNRFNHEIALYPDQGVAFVEGLGAEVPLASVVRNATGIVHPPEKFDSWLLATVERFGGATVMGVALRGLWFDQSLPHEANPIEDHNSWYKVGVEPGRVDELREFVKDTARDFGQKCLYLERAGEADFVWDPAYDPTNLGPG